MTPPAQRSLSDRGTGETVVLLHALGLDHHMWDDVAADLAASYRVTAPDLRGHGAAVRAPGTLTMEQHVADLDALLNALGVERAHVVGLSYGGAVAQMFALAHPARVASLAIAASFARANRAAFLDRADAARRDGMDAQVDVTLQRWFSAGARERDDAAVRYARDRVRGADRDRWIEAWQVLAAMDSLDRLGEIAVPTTVIAGECDVSTPPEMMREIAARIPGASFSVIPAGVHMLSLENAAELTRRLREHLASVS